MTEPTPTGNVGVTAAEAAALRTPQEWCDLLDARVVDPDGWRDGTRDWAEPIDRAEFDARLRACTVDSRGYPTFFTIPSVSTTQEPSA